VELATETSHARAPGGPVAEPPLTDGEDVLALVLGYNSAKYDAPPDSFRAGHVTPRQLDAKAIDKTSSGFRVQLPNGAPITTPAIHAGYLVSSGGFHSKQIYAFKAQSGDFAWAVDLDDDGPSAPACEDRVCVFNTESCTVFALAVDTGEMMWSWWLGDPLMSAPTIANGMVFTSYPAQGNSAAANVQQQAAPNHEQANSRRERKAGKGRPPGQSHALAAFDLQSGEMLWTRWIDSDVMSAPVAIGNSLYASSFAGTVYKFDQKTGNILAARKSRATSAPVIAGDDVFYTKRTDAGGSAMAEEGIARDNAKAQKKYVAAKKKAVYLEAKEQRKSSYAKKGKSLDASNGFGGGAPASANTKSAEANVGQASVSTLQAFQGSRILSYRGSNINTMGDEVIATDAETGKELWKHSINGDLAGAGGALATAPAAAGGNVFVATLDGRVLQLDPSSGKIARTYEIGAPVRSQPLIQDGWLYVGTDDGKLVGIDTTDASLTGWPQWGGDAQRTGVRH
jgi:outer membrane protein assembly factor BamB